MAKRILLIAGNYWPELTGIGKYNGEMIDWMSNNGYECSVIATFPYYPQWKVQSNYNGGKWFKKELRKTKNGVVSITRCPHFIPANPSGFKRLISEFTIFLSFSLALVPTLFKKKNDYVLTVAPPFTLGLLALVYKKLKGAKFLYHVQDLQIEAARDLNMLNSPKIINSLFLVESIILNNAAVISSISKNMMRKVKAKSGKEIVFFPNWVDLSHFCFLGNKDELKKSFGLKVEDIIILYSGSIGEKQGLEMILSSANYFKNNTKVKFVICGEGPYRENLKNQAAELFLSNVFFFPLQSSERFNSFLNMADVHLILQKSCAGDLVLPSKLSTVLAIGGVAIVSANPGTSLYEIMDEYDLGYIIDPENQQELNDGILYAINNDNRQKRENAINYANIYLSINAILNNYSGIIMNGKLNERVYIKEGRQILI